MAKDVQSIVIQILTPKAKDLYLHPQCLSLVFISVLLIYFDYAVYEQAAINTYTKKKIICCTP